MSKLAAPEENKEKLTSQHHHTLGTELCQPLYQKISAKSTESDHFPSEKMTKLSSLEEHAKEIKEKLSKCLEKNSLFTLINLPEIKLMVLHLKFQFTLQM
jgi:hypothetical protein